MRSDRILKSMHKVFRHDLPNQMVALQSLLQLLNAEEASRLSDDGREYVRRLQNATQRASEMVRFLKHMEQLNTFVPRLEEISLDALARELQGELQRHHPDKRFQFEWSWNEPNIVGDSRTFLQALLQLFAGFASENDALCRIRAWSERRRNAIELVFELEELVAPRDDGSASSSPRWNQHALEQSLDIILGREWLALSNGALDVSPPTGGRVSFRILITNR